MEILFGLLIVSGVFATGAGIDNAIHKKPDDVKMLLNKRKHH